MDMRDDLTRWLTDRRWFAGKGRAIARLDANSIGRLHDTPLVELIADPLGEMYGDVIG